MRGVLLVLVAVVGAVHAVAYPPHDIELPSNPPSGPVCVHGQEGDACDYDRECAFIMACIGGKCGFLDFFNGEAHESALKCSAEHPYCGTLDAWCDVDAGVCRMILQGGEVCVDDAQCSSEQCVGGTCALLDIGSACVPTRGSNPCEVGAYCSPDGVCVAEVPRGGSCSAEMEAIFVVPRRMSTASLYDVCGVGQMCNGAVGEQVCGPTNSVEEGEPCSASVSCVTGLSCIFNVTTLYRDNVVPQGVCGPGLREGEACVDSVECGAGLDCLCGGRGETGVCTRTEPECHGERLSLLLCVAQYVGTGADACHSSYFGPFGSTKAGEYGLRPRGTDSCTNRCKTTTMNWLCCLAEQGTSDTYPIPQRVADDFCLHGSDDDDEGETSGGRASSAALVTVLATLFLTTLLTTARTH